VCADVFSYHVVRGIVYPSAPSFELLVIISDLNISVSYFRPSLLVFPHNLTMY
jgi:hypothetical protein